MANLYDRVHACRKNEVEEVSPVVSSMRIRTPGSFVTVDGGSKAFQPIEDSSHGESSTTEFLRAGRMEWRRSGR